MYFNTLAMETGHADFEVQIVLLVISLFVSFSSVKNPSSESHPIFKFFPFSNLNAICSEQNLANEYMLSKTKFTPSPKAKSFTLPQIKTQATWILPTEWNIYFKLYAINWLSFLYFVCIFYAMYYKKESLEKMVFKFIL